VWQGERKLLPTTAKSHECIVRCLRGRGYLRMMSNPNRLLLVQGRELRIPGGEIATVSGSQSMLIEMNIVVKQESTP